MLENTSGNFLLEMQNIVKRYPGVLALDEVSFDLKAGEVHCLLGENGAGKSTLMKILSGAISKDSGKILIENKEVEIKSPSDSQELGIGIIYQDFKLVPELSVSANIFLGNELLKNGKSFIDSKRMNDAAVESLQQLGESFSVTAPVKNLSVAQRQIVEIAKAINRKVKILAMDEPTASLTSSEIKRLFEVIKKLQNEGVGIIYISHRLEEIFDIGDRVTVLRDGKNVNTDDIKNVGKDKLIQWMVGRELAGEFPRNIAKKGSEILRIENVSNERLDDISLSLYEGEVLGLAGLVGAGRSELVRAVFGADKISSGAVYLYEKKMNIKSPRDAIINGIALLTEDRNLFGLFNELSIRENISVSNLKNILKGPFVNRKNEVISVKEYFDQLKIKAPSIETNVEALSGGNRQKVVLARWLFTNSRVIIFDEPTAGIDIGVKYEIYSLIKNLVENGIGVIVISSELPELIGICDRIAVMCEGSITGELEKNEFSQERILELATTSSNSMVTK